MGKTARKPIDTAYCRTLVRELEALSLRMIAAGNDRATILDGAMACAAMVALHDAAEEIDRLRAELAGHAT